MEADGFAAEATLPFAAAVRSLALALREWCTGSGHVPIPPEGDQAYVPISKADVPKSIDQEDNGTLVNTAKRVHNIAWEKIHSGPYRDVSRIWRVGFGVSSLVLGMLHDGEDEALRRIDIAMLMGGFDSGGGDIFELLHVAAAMLDPGSVPSSTLTEDLADGGIELGSIDEHGVYRGCGREIATSIPRRRGLSLDDFIRDHLIPRSPVVLEGSYGWIPAVTRWKSREFWRQFRARTVPIEIGRAYTENRDWTQKLLLMGTFLDEFYDKPHPSKIGYLAQHALFDQFPSLEADVATPEYALAGDDDYLLRLFWMGPAGVYSPLHVDPYENCYLQVVGEKYICLVDPVHTASVSPFQRFLTNTSSVESSDLLDGTVDYEKFPAFKDVPKMDTVLQPGDILFIPDGWWHFLKGLTKSIAISHWFRKLPPP